MSVDYKGIETQKEIVVLESDTSGNRTIKVPESFGRTKYDIRDL